MNLLIMGPQGSGKGTQAALLAKKYDIPHISTGDIFRENMKNDTELGKLAKSYTDKGELVPDSVTGDLVEDRLAQADAAKGFILDGYPRNAAQVERLDEILTKSGRKVEGVINLTADRAVLMERIAKRAEIEGRADDTPEAIEKRLAIYDKETAPLTKAYAERGIVLEVNGIGQLDEITQAIVKGLESL